MSDRQTLVLSREIVVAESNSYVRILLGSCETAVRAHAHYKIGQKQRRTTGATSGGLKLQCISNFHIF